ARWRFRNPQSLNVQGRACGRRIGRRIATLWIGGRRWSVLRSLSSSAIGCATVAGAEHHTELFTANPFDVTDVGETRRWGDQRSSRYQIGCLCEDSVQLGVVRRAGPICSCAGADGPNRPFYAAEDRRSEWRCPDMIFFEHLKRLLAQRRREVDHIVRNFQKLPRICRRLGRERLRRRCFLARYSRLLDGTFFNRPYRLARHAIEDVEPTDLMRQRDSLDRAAVDVDVRQHRRGRVVEIPNRMMNELVIPLALAGLQVNSHKALAKEIVSRPVSAEIIGCRRFDGEINQTELFVDCELSPNTGVAIHSP